MEDNSCNPTEGGHKSATMGSATYNNNNQRINIMKYINTRDTGTGQVTASIEVDYYVPRKGDTLGQGITATEDFNIGVEVKWDGKKYVGSPVITEDGYERPVFYGKVSIPDYVKGEHIWSWRKGEFCATQS